MGALRARVLVADDSDVFLGVAASVISATSTLRLLGAVGSGEEAIQVLPQLQPDLVLVDLFGELHSCLHERLQLRSLIADLGFFGGECGAKLLALLEKDCLWDAAAGVMMSGWAVSM